jgi:outer membrane usher protein
VLGWRRFARGFRSFTNNTDGLFPLHEARVGLAAQWHRLNLSADYVRTVTGREVRDTGFVRVATSLARDLWLLGELQTTRVDERSGWAANLYLRKDFDGQRWTSASLRTEPHERRVEAEAGQQLPVGEGRGWRVGTTSAWTQGGRLDGATAWGAVDWNLRPVSLALAASSTLRGPGTSWVQAEVAGALVGLDGYWGLARQVSDAFVLARLGVPQAGVQPQGRTDAQGRLLLPQVSSFGRQEVSLADQDLGIQYLLPERQRSIAAPYRGGTVVDFGVTRVHAVAGTAWLVEGGSRTPVAARAWALAAGGRSLAIATGAAGEFYLEDAPPGDYRGTLQARGREHACRLHVPAFEEAVHESKEGIVCE